MIMLSIAAEEDIDPRVTLERHPSSCYSLPPPLLLLNSLSSKSVDSYSKLRQEPIRLTVLKLDGSSFDIQVTKTATILELKHAVEDVFSHLEENGPLEISWPHVWGHFCLCYDDQKLITETDHIKHYGIRDGDQLQFIRHRTVNYNLIKKRSKTHVRQEWMSLPRADSNEQLEQNGNDEEAGEIYEDDEESVYHSSGESGVFLQRHDQPNKMSPYSNSWPPSYAILPTNHTHSAKEAASRFCNGIRSLLGIYSEKTYHRNDSWRDD